MLSANNSLTAALVAPLFWATPLLLSVGSAALFCLGAAGVFVHLYHRPAGAAAAPERH